MPMAPLLLLETGITVEVVAEASETFTTEKITLLQAQLQSATVNMETKSPEALRKSREGGAVRCSQHLA